MDIKLIAIDLDGTLLHSDRTLSDENIQAIREAKEAGVQVILCTVRPLLAMNYLLDEIGLRDEGDLAITYNGGLIQKTQTGEVVRQMTLNREECIEVFELGRDLHLPVNFIDLKHIYEPPYPEAAESIYMSDRRKDTTKIDLQFKEVDIDNLPEPFFINKIVMSRPGEELDAMIPKIPAAYHDKFNIYKSQEFILEILPPSVDKGSAMRFIGEALGFEKHQIMGLGDQENDLTLVSEAGLGVAMDNAIPAVKEVADYITKSNNENGVAHAINKFVLKK